MMSAQRVFANLFQGLSSRQKDVVVSRFGLSGKEPKTLAALGEEYEVTRERIRQIEASALEVLRKKAVANPECKEILARGRKFIEHMGGVAGEAALLAHCAPFVEGLASNHLNFLVETGGLFSFHPEDEHFRAFYYLDKNNLKKPIDFLNRFAKTLHAKKHEVLSGKYDEHFKDFVKRERVDAKLAAHYVSISKRVHTNPFGDIGLVDWPEIKPRTIRDRIYLVLKKKGEPLHFRAIADFINEAKLGGRKALAPTVHNELIKDKRFVLVGRGVYALAEHGYEPGTAKEVISRILKKEGPLDLNDIILAVQKERFFKPNTVLANLQNRSFFERLGNGTYRVREA